MKDDPEIGGEKDASDQVSEYLDMRLSHALHCATDRHKWLQITKKRSQVRRDHDAQQ